MKSRWPFAWCLGNNLPSECHQDVDSVFRQLDGAALSWQSWKRSGTRRGGAFG